LTVTCLASNISDMRQETVERTPQSSGGTARNQKLHGWERAFIAMLGGSRRPITKDRWPSPEQVATELKQEQVEPSKRIPWLAYFAVSMKGEMVSCTLPKQEVVRQLAGMGDIAGLLGVILFGNQFRTYTRRFLLDPLAQKRLDKAAKLYTEHFKNFETEELRRRAKDASEAQLSAQVYLDPGGETISMFYSFHPQHLPEPGSKRVGTVYLVDREKAQGRYDAKEIWTVRWHSEDPHSRKHALILEQAKVRFNEVVEKLAEIQKTEVPKR
jgi:hypothetical protein